MQRSWYSIHRVPAPLGLLLAVSLLVIGCADSRRPVASADAVASTVASEWFDLLYAIVRDEGLAPPPAARLYGHASLALYEAVVPGAPGQRSLVGQVTHLEAMPTPDSGLPQDWPSAVNGAVAAVVRGMLPNASADSLGAIDDLEARLRDERANAVGVSASTVGRSMAHGRAVAAVVLKRAAADGYATFDNCAYTPPTGAGIWVATPPAYAPPLQPCWGQLEPMVLPSAATCVVPPQTPHSTSPGSVLYGQMHEVYTVVNHLTAEQLTIARYWADNPKETGTPPGHWIRIVGQFAREHELSLAVAAEAYARVGIAVNDAFISCWWAKYQYLTQRPVTYIRAHIDPSWALPVVATPPFPDYPSGHSVQSGAAASVLGDLFGSVEIHDATHVELGYSATTYQDCDAAADEAAISRLYGGIHYRDSIDLGVEHGHCIGREVVARVHFRQ